jgi:hypothetical protein
MAVCRTEIKRAFTMGTWPNAAHAVSIDTMFADTMFADTMFADTMFAITMFANMKS